MISLDKLPPEILYKISEFLDPSPVLYTRLAMVNKDFYRVFTSDRLWSAFDIYDKRTGIFEHFSESIRGYEGLLTYVDAEFRGLDLPLPQTCSQRYIWFWYFARGGFSSTQDFNPREAKMVLGFQPDSFAYLPSKYHDHTEVALYACKKTLRNFARVSDRLADDEEFVKECLKECVDTGLDYRFDYIEDLQERVGPRLEEWLWEAAPSFYVEVWHTKEHMDDAQPPRHPRDLITNRETALAALKGNATYLNHFPQYHNDLGVVLAALTPPVICDPIYELLRNHRNDTFVAGVLDEHPFLLYAAPDHLRGSKTTFYRFLDGIEYMETVNGGKSLISSTENLLDWVPEPFWADPDVAGRIVDVCGHTGKMVDICGGVGTINVPAAFLHIIKQHFGDFEWAKKRVEHFPPMWRYAPEEFQHTYFLRHAIDTMRLFVDAPHGLRTKICYLGNPSWDMPLDRADYSMLRELVLAGCSLEEWARVYRSHKMIKATISGDLLGEHREIWCLRSTGPDPFLWHIVETIRSELLTEYVQDPTNLADLKTLRFLLHHLWDAAETLEFAETYLGSRPPVVGLEEFAKLDEDLYYTVPMSIYYRYSMPVQDAARLVRWNAHLYWSLSEELYENQEVYTAIGRFRRHERRSSPAAMHRTRPLLVLKSSQEMRTA